MLGGSDWNCKMVEVLDEATKQKTVFWCDQLVKKDILVKLAAGGAPVNDRHRYKITVNTADERGAGSDANVYITVYGENGDTGKRQLDTSADNFQRGKSDIFVIEAPFLGEIRRVVIGHDNSGWGPGWKLDDVIVEDINAAFDAPDWHKKRFFNADCWLDKKVAPYQTECELLPASGGQRMKKQLVKYFVTVHTSDISDAGTDADVLVELKGPNGTMGWTALPEQRGNPFGAVKFLSLPLRAPTLV